MVVRSVEAATRADLGDLAKRDKALSESAEAVGALAMAAIVDDEGTSPNQRALAFRELREALADLRERAPVVEEADGVSKLQRQAGRKLRRAS